VVGAWQSATQDLLLDRRDKGVLQRLFLLVDSRRGPMQLDRNVMGWLDEAQIPYSVVLTKADRVVAPIVIKHVNELCMRYASQKALEDEEDVLQSPVIHVTSSKQGMGVHELMLSVETEFVGHDEN
jgi:GTP-binding protein